MITSLIELATTKLWMAHPPYFNAYRKVVQENIAGRVALSAEDVAKRKAFCIGMTAEGNAVRMAMPGSRVEHDDNEPEVQQFVAILPVCGPITRNGDACSYGSVDLRDAMIEAANEDECSGIILYINSGGGSAAAIPDYKYAIDYAHQQNKKVIAFVDGLCASAALYLAVLCDERYYMNDKDQIGSVGVMAAFYTEKDGEKNQFTNETYHELYAKESYEKNKWHRDAADGNYDDIQADLDALADEFMADVKSACPNAEDKHLHGAMFNAEDISGILMDGKSTLDECIAKLVSNHASANRNIETSNHQSTINMNTYPLTQSLLGVESLVVTEEGAFINAVLLDTCEANLQTAETAKAEAAQQLADAQKALADAQAHSKEIEEQLATAQADKQNADKAMEDLRAEFGKKEADLTAQLDTLRAEYTKGEEALKGAQDALATAEQTLADRDAKIAALTSAPAPQQEQASPESNGSEASAPQMRDDYPVFDGTKETMTEFKARLAKWKQDNSL